MGVEFFVTVQKAVQILEELFKKHGKEPSRNLHHMLNDMRRAEPRYRNRIPFLKIAGRVIYRVKDLKAWADKELSRSAIPTSGIIAIEGRTSVERLTKLRAVLTN